MAAYLFVSICCASNISPEDNDPKERALLLSYHIEDAATEMEKLQLVERKDANRSGYSTSLPKDCWQYIMSFLSSPREKLLFRSISRDHARTYNEVMDSYANNNIRHFLEGNISKRCPKYKALDDAIKSMVLIPGASINLNKNSDFKSLHRFHKFQMTLMVRGIDSLTHLEFISILLWPDEINEDEEDTHLLICGFNQTEMVHAQIHPYYRISRYTHHRRLNRFGIADDKTSKIANTDWTQTISTAGFGWADQNVARNRYC